MKNSSPFGRNPITVLGTILAVIFLGATYLYVYRPNNERRIREQGFRAMQNIDGNIQAKITNGVSLLNNVLSAYISSSNSGQREGILNYTKSISSPSLTISSVDTLNKKETEKIFSPGSDSVYTIRVDTLLQQFNLILAKKVGAEAYQVSMRIGFAQFIKPLLPDNVLFDQYLVFSNGRTVYQTFPSGFSQVKPDSLLSEKNGIKGAGILTRKISGTTYQMFVQPVNFIVHSNWVIVGLLSDEKYQYEKNQLPPDTVLFMITVALAIIISFPLIKLYHMGNQDRLTIFDGIWSVAVAMLLMSLLFFSFFKYNTPFRPGENIDPKDKLANDIVKSFQNELKAKYQQLRDFDSLVSKHRDTLQVDVVLENKQNNSAKNLNSALGQPKNYFTKTIDQIFKQTDSAKADINQVYWMDQHGQELFKWDYLKYNAPHGNFFQRNYVKNILAGRVYLLDGNLDRPYYLDQLISWTTGDFTTVISRKSNLSTADNTMIEAFAFNMKSLDRAILPNGYLFALVNQNGKVLYHSNKNRNLNENLLQEFSNHEELLSAVEAHAQKTFSTSYLGKKYNVQVKPVTGLPYFIVVFSAVGFEETRDMEIYCFTLAMLFVFFCFLVLELLTVFLVSSNRSVLKNQQFDSSWIGPKAKFHQQYIVSTLLNIGVVALLYVFSRFATFAAFFFMLLLSATGIMVFLMSLYAQQYQKEGERTLFKNKRRTIRTLSVFILLINLLAIFNLDNPLWFFLYEFLMLLLAWFVFVYGAIWIEAGKESVFKAIGFTWNYVHSFTLMAITRLIITSGIPVALFYVMTYNYEQNLLIRYKHYDFARHLIDRYPNANSANLSAIKDGKGAVYMDGSWIDSISYFTKSKPKDIAEIVKKYTDEEALTLATLGSFRLYHDSSAVRESNLYQFNATDSSFFYNHLYTGALNNNTDTITTFLKNPYANGYIKIWSKNLNYRLPSIYKKRELYFWLLMLLLLVVFYFMILNVIRKLFVLNLPETNIWKAIDNEILLCKDLNRLLFIIGLPGSHKLNHLLELIKNKKLVQDDGTPFIYDRQQLTDNNVLVLDLIQIPDDKTDPTSKDNTDWKVIEENAFSKNYKLILVNHFEYNIQDETTNRIKINLLEKLMVENKCRIIILSTIHPTAFLDSIYAQAGANSNKAVQDLERWHILLGHYRIVIQPIEKKTLDLKSDIWQERWLKWENRGLDSNQIERIINETNYTHFLSEMQVATVEAASKITKKETIANGDALAFKLQVTAHYFYMYIWQSLTKEEKFLLYDLAEDGLVNGFDTYNLSMLISKGVIVREDTSLKLFNGSFRNFILTAIGNTEALKIKSQMQDNGNWNKLKTPLLVVIFAILAFLLTSQQEAYSKLIAYVSALAAGIPVFIKLISMFDGSGSQKSS